MWVVHAWAPPLSSRCAPLPCLPYQSALCPTSVPHLVPPCPSHPFAAGVWGYWSTDGLGLFEYMLLAEELGAEPIW